MHDEITLHQLRVLVALEKLGSIDQLARQQNRTPMAIRSMLRRLGAACGESEPLFRAGETGKVLLTVRGLELLGDAKHILALVDGMTNQQRLIVVAAYSTLMLQIFEAFHGRKEPWPFSFLAGADAARAQGGAPLTDRLRTHAADIVIAPADDHPGLESHPLYSWTLQAVRQQGPSGAPVSITSLEGKELLVSPSGHRSRRLLEESALEAGVSLNIRLELADHGVLREIALRSEWVAVIPDDAFGLPQAPMGDVIQRKDGKPITDRYALYHRKAVTGGHHGRHEERVAAVVRTICDLLSEKAVNKRRSLATEASSRPLLPAS
ncbi:MAG: LysR family transcriptional regulator [Jatrophihabitantaceae bacterium]